MRKVDALKKLAEKLGVATAGTIKGVTDAINAIAEGIHIEGAEKTLFEVKEYMESSLGVIKDDGTVSDDFSDCEYTYDNGEGTVWVVTPLVNTLKADKWNCVDAYGFYYDQDKTPIQKFEGSFEASQDGFVRFCFLENKFESLKIQTSSPGYIMSEAKRKQKENDNFEKFIKKTHRDGVGGVELKEGNTIDIQAKEWKKVVKMDLGINKIGTVIEIYELWHGAIPGKPPVGTFSHLDPLEPPDDIISEPIQPEDSTFRMLVKEAPECYVKDEDTGEYRYNAAELLYVTLYYEDGTETTQRFIGSLEAHNDIAKLMTEIDVLKGQNGGGA